jgi:hypothetical protein
MININIKLFLTAIFYFILIFFVLFLFALLDDCGNLNYNFIYGYIIKFYKFLSYPFYVIFNKLLSNFGNCIHIVVVIFGSICYGFLTERLIMYFHNK